MMANLSSHTLFHFRRSLELLEDVLLNGLKFNIMSERLVDSGIAYFVNEICFCNIPLSMIEEHADWYGHYAIGLKRSVSRGFGITPVFYIHSKSPQVKHTNSNASVDWFKNQPITGYLKSDKGKQYKVSEAKYKDKLFYDEKEWRVIKGPVLVEKFTNNEYLYNRLQEISVNPIMAVNDRIRFHVDDIEYIILDSMRDMDEFYRFIEHYFTLDQRKTILPKILLYSQIIKDF